MNWAFISIPKTGTNSIHRALGTDMKDNHKALKLIKSDYSFAFMRHPLDRLVSWYFGHRKYNPALKQYDISFTKWITNGCKHHWTEDNLKQFGVDNPLNQYEFIEIDGEVKLDFLGKFETLQQDFDKVCDHLGIQTYLPHLLKSQHDNWTKYFDKGLAEHAQKMFERDFELWHELH